MIVVVQNIKSHNEHNNAKPKVQDAYEPCLKIGLYYSSVATVDE